MTCIFQLTISKIQNANHKDSVHELRINRNSEFVDSYNTTSGVYSMLYTGGCFRSSGMKQQFLFDFVAK